MGTMKERRSIEEIQAEVGKAFREACDKFIGQKMDDSILDKIHATIKPIIDKYFDETPFKLEKSTDDNHTGEIKITFMPICMQWTCPKCGKIHIFPKGYEHPLCWCGYEGVAEMLAEHAGEWKKL